MKRVKLTRQEREIEESLVKGEYVDVNELDLTQVAQAVAHRKKDAVLNLRINREDLEILKQKARRLGVRYQPFLSELIHRVAHSGYSLR